jgi:hypothetical protein
MLVPTTNHLDTFHCNRMLADVTKVSIYLFLYLEGFVSGFTFQFIYIFVYYLFSPTSHTHTVTVDM